MANTAAAAEQLRAVLLGEVIVPGDAQYDAARAIWNGNIQRRPAIIARCRGTADVVAAVRCAVSTIWRRRYAAVVTRWPATRCATTAW